MVIMPYGGDKVERYSEGNVEYIMVMMPYGGDKVER